MLKDFVWLDTQDFDEALAFWESNYQQVRLQPLEEGPFDLVIAGEQIDGSRVYYVESNSTYRVRTCLNGSFISIAAILGGSYTLEWAGRSETGVAGAVFMAVPGTEFSYIAQRVRGIGARVGLHDLNRVRAKSLPTHKRAQLNRFMSAADSEDLLRLMSFLVSEIERHGPSHGSPSLQLKLLTQALTDRVSAHFTEALGPRPDLHQSDLDVVLKCEEMIESHPREFFSIRELSIAVGWSERQIYRAFEGICACTPAEFIRRSKMIRARGMMWNSHSSVLSVTELARQIGYRNVRRFTREMAEEFPEEPNLA
jgi:AraC-like DNA-binding protein